MTIKQLSDAFDALLAAFGALFAAFGTLFAALWEWLYTGVADFISALIALPHNDIVATLWTWTPFLLGGFLWNILVSIASMSIGTIPGIFLARMRLSQRRSIVGTGRAITEILRNIPTFVFLFYLAFLIPVEMEIAGKVYAFPAWLKASLALSVAVAGFVSDNLYVAWKNWREGDRAAALLFIPGWTSYLLIIVMASSTASVIGVDEIVSRCNVIIAAVGNDDLMLWIYLYASAFFLLFCFPLHRVMAIISQRIAART